MKVYLHGSEGKPPVPLHVVRVCPPNDPFYKTEAPSDWVDPRNPSVGIEQTIDFVHGVADVDPRMAKYLIERGIAQKTRLIIAGYYGH